MSYGIIDDGDEIHIRARITQRWELAELVTKLQARVDGMPVDISTERPPWSAYSDNDTITISDSAGMGSGATATVKDGTIVAINLVNPGPKYEFNQRELKNE